MNYTKSFEVRWSDLDANRHLANTAYVVYAGDIRLMCLMDHGFSPQKFAELEFGPVIFKDIIEYFKEINIGEKIIVDMQIAGLSHNGDK